MARLLNVDGRRKAMPVLDMMILPFRSLDGRFFFLVRDRRGKDESKVYSGGASYKEFEKEVRDYFRRSGARDVALCKTPKSFDPQVTDKQALQADLFERMQKAFMRRFGRALNWFGDVK